MANQNHDSKEVEMNGADYWSGIIESTKHGQSMLSCNHSQAKMAKLWLHAHMQY